MISPSAKLREFGEYRRLSGVDEIGRRCLANNAFDGILTMVGVLMGSYISGITETRVVLFTAFATCLAMGISGFSGAYMAESAERKHNLHELEKAMLVDLGNTTQARANQFAVVVVSLIDGLSPLVAGMMVVTPFLFPHLWTSTMAPYYVALAVAFVMLFALGAFLARIARESIVPAGVKMLLAGAACVVASMLLNVAG